MKCLEIGKHFATDPSENDIHKAIDVLKSAWASEGALAALVRYKRASVGPLKRLLLCGDPTANCETRLAAIKALSALRAKDVLMVYLKRRKNFVTPTIPTAEKKVEEAAARELGAFQTTDVFKFLLDLALPPPHPGIVEALSQFAAVESIPVLIRALEDESCCALAEETLRRLGRNTEAALRCAALTPLPSAEEERASSLRRRIKALDLLLEMNPSEETWEVLRPLLMDSDPHIVTAAARLAAQRGSPGDRLLSVARLLKASSQADSLLQGEIQNCLISLYPDARRAVDEEIAKRLRAAHFREATDPLLRMLLRVRRQMGPGPMPVEDRRV